MGNMYDDAKFGVVERKWIGLTKGYGGDAAAGFDLAAATHDPGTVSHVSKLFFPGAIEVRKIGAFVTSDVSNASGGLMNFRVLTRGASASVCGDFSFSSGTVAAGVIGASKLAANLTVTQCKKGEYMTFQSLEPTTKTKATEVKATTTGKVAFFVDYIRKYVSGDNVGWT